MSAPKLVRSERVRFTPIERTVIHEADRTEFRFGFVSGACFAAVLAFLLAAWLVGHRVVVVL